jgi:hypothetical protein
MIYDKEAVYLFFKFEIGVVGSGSRIILLRKLVNISLASFLEIS